MFKAKFSHRAKTSLSSTNKRTKILWPTLSKLNLRGLIAKNENKFNKKPILGFVQMPILLVNRKKPIFWLHWMSLVWRDRERLNCPRQWSQRSLWPSKHYRNRPHTSNKSDWSLNSNKLTWTGLFRAISVGKAYKLDKVRMAIAMGF